MFPLGSASLRGVKEIACKGGGKDTCGPSFLVFSYLLRFSCVAISVEKLIFPRPFIRNFEGQRRCAKKKPRRSGRWAIMLRAGPLEKVFQFPFFELAFRLFLPRLFSVKKFLQNEFSEPIFIGNVMSGIPNIRMGKIICARESANFRIEFDKQNQLVGKLSMELFCSNL